MKWYVVPGIELTGQPFIKKIKLSGKGIIIIGYQNNLYALGSACPHAGAELSGGWCKEGKIICPFHRYSYDLKTGKGSPGQNDYVDSYPVEMRAGEVYVGIDTLWDRVFAIK
ncbi:Rieske 2Fe-2S domain-containing protein [Mucilaginibacter rigui]|uniref:Rieske 2Fe-2S domain-containing protein n=1 Tax=Mucilaginibacter rigui TaxID=534635 RepID=A0ABR7X2Y3_9SPHI|nr:Rieske 2Fe-2S domain-containing protein [Mucilaginibacter rigui]MBD1384953.1 Rieske 2Fe-2S domain-containing protein [Mucilaginibacter rigui]